MAFDYSTVRWLVDGEIAYVVNTNRPLSDFAALLSDYINTKMLNEDQIFDNFYDKSYIDSEFYTAEQIGGSFYTKTESDNRFMLKSEAGSGFYTKQEIDENFYNRSQSDERYYTKTYIDGAYYTKSEVESLLEGFEPENRVRDIQLDSSHIYTLVPEDIGSTVRFYSTEQDPPSIMTINMLESSFGSVGDEIQFIAPDSISFQDGDEAFSFISSVGGVVYNPMCANGLLPAFRSGGSVVTLKKLTNTNRGMADWVLYNDLALYTAADLWIDIITRSDLVVQQISNFIDHFLFPYQDGGVWKWLPISFVNNEVPDNTTRLTVDSTALSDTARLRSDGTTFDFSSFVIVTKPVPRYKRLQMTVTTNQWSSFGSSWVSFMEDIPEDPNEIPQEFSFTSNRTYTSEPSLVSTPMYIGVRNDDSNIKPTNINMTFQFTD